jgi:lysophospholipase L1-like esterase
VGLNRKSAYAGWAVAAVLAGTVAFSSPVAAVGGATQAASGDHWVDTWTAMPQLTEPGNMPPAPFTGTDSVFVNSTVRQTVHVTQGGDQLRLRFSNAFGGAALPITAASIALPAGGAAGVSGIQPGSSHALTFDGRPSAVVPTGSQVVSDPVGFHVPAGANLTVTMYLAQGQASTALTSHPGSRTTSYMEAGDHLDDTDLSGAATADHWYFISGVESWSSRDSAAAIVLGDSLSDGRGSTTNQNDRWPDQLAARLRRDPGTARVAVDNQAAGGNRLLNDGLGPNALSRVDRDVLAQSGVQWLLVFEGVNDIGTADATPQAQQQVTADVIAAYDQIIRRAHAQGIRVYGATLTPFGGNTGYDDPQGYREKSREAINDWIRNSGRFDAVVDFDKAARDPQNPRNILPQYDSGDHLHLNPAGYGALAAAVPDRLFLQQPLPPGFGFN